MKKAIMMVLMLAALKAGAQSIPAYEVKEDFHAKNLNLEVLGQLHNDYLDFMFRGISGNAVCFLSDGFHLMINELSRQYFPTAGIDLHGNVLDDPGLEQYISQTYAYGLCNAKGLSQQGSQILCQLNDLLLKYESGSEVLAGFGNDVELLLRKAAALADETERITVQATLTIAVYSVRYWEANAAVYRSALGPMCTQDYRRPVFAGLGISRVSEGNRVRTDYFQPSFAVERGAKARVPYQRRQIIIRMGMSDAIGALQGAIFGSLGGPIGAFAGALVGAGTRSVIRGLFYGFTGW